MASAAASSFSLLTENYITQKKFWPKEGRHILAQYDDSSIVVYQAYKPSIADYAVENQSHTGTTDIPINFRFGGKDFSFERMSWIKTNFLWMMYRCGWATKYNQERVLAIRLTLDGFTSIIGQAYTVELQKSEGLQTRDINVRLQWDPDHSPKYAKVPRRAIQLGLKGSTLLKYGTEWIIDIQDITPFVKQQYDVLNSLGADEIVTPKERIFYPKDTTIAEKIALDYDENYKAENLDK